ncbi:MAG: cyanophycin synthetase, partial [Clostridiales bacterium]|nr:cyanophycin synthetase [Clostridiales bacterium]
GGFSVYNALCALGCTCALGIPLAAAAAALAAAPGVKGRMEVVPTPGPGTVIIDYAHTPDALENALTALRDFTPGRLICLFGCGGDRDRSKRPVMGAIAASLADFCVVTSDNPRTEAPEAIIADILKGMDGFETPRLVEPGRPEAIRAALAMLREGDTLLLAGKGHETYQEVNGEKRHMDERELVAEYFNKGCHLK